MSTTSSTIQNDTGGDSGDQGTAVFTGYLNGNVAVDDYGDVKNEETEEPDDEKEEEEKKKKKTWKKKPGAFGQMTPVEQLVYNIDRTYRMSSLATKYFYARHFYMMFLPSVSITMFSAIFAFMIKSELPISEEAKTLIAFLVGCFSIVNVFLQNMSNELNYDHCNKSLRTLALGLNNLLSQIDYLDSTRGGLPFDKVEEIEKTMNTILAQNDAAIPVPIVTAYDLAATRIGLRLFPPVRFDSKDKSAYNKLSWALIMEIIHNELFCAIINYKSWFSGSWPLFLPDPEAMVDQAINNVIKVLGDEEESKLYEHLLKGQDLIRHSNKRNTAKRRSEGLVVGVAFEGDQDGTTNSNGPPSEGTIYFHDETSETTPLLNHV